MTPAVVWFRQDLRLGDNPALTAAIGRGGPVIPVFNLDEAADGRWRPGGASRWWLHGSLSRLDEALRRRGSRLILARGESNAILSGLARASGAGAIYWNRLHEPAAVARDAGLKADWLAAGLDARSFNAGLLFEPHAVATRQGQPFRVFTPFWRRCLELEVGAPRPLPLGSDSGNIPPPRDWPRSLALEGLGLLPAVRWDAGLERTWVPGEASAQRLLRVFVRAGVDGYARDRNRPDVAGTSRLSPHLHFGEIGPRQVWAALVEAGAGEGKKAGQTRGNDRESPGDESAGRTVFLKELGWREFAQHTLIHCPRCPEAPLREEFARFPWAEDPGGRLFEAWRRGRTGYPIVDAGMRELWSIGWMHNRVRMVAASFLVKHLRLPWTAGADWFWDTLVDADLANNTLGWQWTAGCGMDAAPYFRIFAPVRQGEAFDPKGDYVRAWVPELARLPASFIHRPWEAPTSVLEAAGVRLGATYPRPVVDHRQARAAALAAFKGLPKSGFPRERGRA